MPPDYDDRTARPTVLHVHGGGFSGGSKDNTVAVMNHFAQLGYVGITIDYRTTVNYWAPRGSPQYVLDAVEDARAAVRFARKNADDLRIDTERI